MQELISKIDSFITGKSLSIILIWTIRKNFLILKGIALAGAGGGGFLYALAKDSTSKQKIQQVIDDGQFNMQFYDAKVSNDGIEFKFS